MNDEIREILEKPNVYSFADETYLYFGDYNKLKYYITNLQQENERLKIKCDFLVGKKLAEIDKNAKQIKIKAIEHEDYKSRVEKAVEKSQELKDSIDKSNFDGMTKTILILGINQIQNILQNGSENQ